MKKFELLKMIGLIAAIIATTVGSSSLLNIKTGQKIADDRKEREELAAQQAAGELLQVFPEATGFEDITSTLTGLAENGVSAVHKEKAGKGFVIIASKTNSPMKDVLTVTFGVDMDGKILGLLVSFANSADFPVDDATLTSFTGLDSTLGGVVVTAGATVSTNTIKEAVTAGFLVLASNDLMKAASKTPEQVFEELLPTVWNGFVKGEDLTASGNITTAYTVKNGSGVVCYVTKGEQTLLALYNVSGSCVVYQPKLIDEATQVYELEEVTDEAVVAEVSEFAAANVTSSYSKLEAQIIKMFDTAANITEVSVNTFNTIVSAATFEFEGATYYAYYSKPINGFEGDAMDIYVVLDSEGKVAKFDVITYFYGHIEYFPVAGQFSGSKYEGGMVGVTEQLYNGSQTLITGATFTTEAVDLAVKDVFAIHKGGNE